MKPFSLLLGFVLLVMSLSSNAATITMPGVACQPYRNVDAPLLTSATGFTGLKNINTDYSALVICPLVGSMATLVNNNIFININSPRDVPVFCVVARSHPTNSRYYISLNFDVRGVGDQRKQLPAVRGFTSQDTMAVYCALPPNAVLKGIDWIE